MRTLFVILICTAALSAQPRKTVFLITDAEGVAGVCRQDQTDPKDSEMRQLLTGEINAAVDGFYDGGADEVIVWDGHDGSQTLSALTIHPRARLLIGKLPPTMTFEQHYSAIGFVGQHAHANRKGGIMAHSYSSLGIQTMLMNGKPVGEIETQAAVAGAFDTPVIFLSGDQAAADDLHAIVPGAELAVVKQGFANYVCLSLSAQAARTLIRERARSAMKNIGVIKPYKVEGPVTIQIEHTTRSALDMDASLVHPDAEIIDARTLRFSGKDFLEAWDQGAPLKDTAVLLIDCPDRKGLVAAVASLLYRYGANITHADQHQDHEAGLFFMRVEWTLDGFDLPAFRTEFQNTAAELHMRWQLKSMSDVPRMAIFASQYLHCLVDLLHRHQSGELNCSIPLVISNHRDAEALAHFYGIEFRYIPMQTANRREGEAEQRSILGSHGIDLVVLARYMQILSPEFVEEYPVRIINVHHSFLPAFVGARPYHAAFDRGVKLIGATSHYVTAALDDGPIIEQDVVRISHRDQVEDLIKKGRDLERAVLARAVAWHLEHRILCYGNKTVVFD